MEALRQVQRQQQEEEALHQELRQQQKRAMKAPWDHEAQNRANAELLMANPSERRPEGRALSILTGGSYETCSSTNKSVIWVNGRPVPAGTQDQVAVFVCPEGDVVVEDAAHPEDFMLATDVDPAVHSTEDHAKTEDLYATEVEPTVHSAGDTIVTDVRPTAHSARAQDYVDAAAGTESVAGDAATAHWEEVPVAFRPEGDVAVDAVAHPEEPIVVTDVDSPVHSAEYNAKKEGPSATDVEPIVHSAGDTLVTDVGSTAHSASVHDYEDVGDAVGDTPAADAGAAVHSRENYPAPDPDEGFVFDLDGCSQEWSIFDSSRYCVGARTSNNKSAVELTHLDSGCYVHVPSCTQADQSSSAFTYNAEATVHSRENCPATTFHATRHQASCSQYCN